MPDLDPLLLSFLEARDAPCPVCEYNLRGLKVDRCPECSAHLHLQVGSENTRLGPWIAAVMSFALAVGFDSVVGTLVTVALIFNMPKSPLEWRIVVTFLAIFWGMAAICGGFIAALIRKRRRWFAMTRRAQWRAAGIMFASVFVVHAVVGFIMARWLN